MDAVNKTLYIPLYGKSYVSKRSIILHDPKAEEIWTAECFPLKGKSASKWLAYYMAMRAAVFDRWLRQHMEAAPEATVLHLGCGMDSRICRVGEQGHLWYDIDLPDVITQRKRYYQENETYRMLAANVTEDDFLSIIEGKTAIVVMEGISMYLKPEQLKDLMTRLTDHFDQVSLLMDCYTEFAAKASKYKNPINDVGVTKVYGLDEPKLLEGSKLSYLREVDMTPADLIDQLQGMEQTVFRKLYAGKIARNMYRMYGTQKLYPFFSFRNHTIGNSDTGT